MPRLNKAQKEARDERKTAVAAQLAADAQTTIGLPLRSIDGAPTLPPPPASALSTNQPLLAAAASEINGVTSTTGNSSHRNRSTSVVSDTPIRANSTTHTATPSNQQTTTTGFASGSKSPLRPASEMSTSEGSESEDDAKEKSFAMDGGIEEGDGDDDEEAALASNNGGSPEVKCMWEDCGKVFTSLAPFINHLHDGEYPIQIGMRGECGVRHGQKMEVLRGSKECKKLTLVPLPLSCLSRPRRHTQGKVCLRVDRMPKKG